MTWVHQLPKTHSRHHHYTHRYTINVSSTWPWDNCKSSQSDCFSDSRIKRANVCRTTESKKRFTSDSTHNRSVQRRVFSANQLPWNWPPTLNSRTKWSNYLTLFLNKWMKTITLENWALYAILQNPGSVTDMTMGQEMKCIYFYNIYSQKWKQRQAVACEKWDANRGTKWATFFLSEWQYLWANWSKRNTQCPRKKETNCVLYITLTNVGIYFVLFWLRLLLG